MKLRTPGALALVVVTSLATAAVPALSSSAVAAAARTLVASSADGTAFDLDEHATGDITVQVTDAGAGVDVDDTQDLRYHWEVTPFDTTVPAVRVPATGKAVAATDVAGEFVVPLPPGGTSGTYRLVAGLGAGTAGGARVAQATVLTVRAGEAALVLDAADPLLATAGGDTPVSGSLRLQDGTGLAGRLVDLTLQRGAAGSDPEADAGFVPAPPDVALTTSAQATTGADGAFSVVLRDLAEDGQGSELGGRIGAVASATPGIGDPAAAGAALDVDVVGEDAPAGSTLVLTDLGDARPGEALPATMTITAPDDTFDTDPVLPGVQGDAGTDRDPVEGQPYTLTLDHGFFTDGEVLPTSVGAPAGGLTDLGTSLTGLTDATGVVDYQVGIARDSGFDDDGAVDAALTAVAGDLSADDTAGWSSADPLNGGRLDVVLSPRSEQDAPVDPAVAGDRTYYDVVVRDQFGNPVADEAVELAYSGDVDDFDYNEDFLVSDLDTSGDLWVVSFEAAEITVEATWDAPTTTFSDTAGATTTGTADVTGSTTASFYELDFDASTFSLRSPERDVVRVGTASTQTVRVLDQVGNPVRGYAVSFFRQGPDGNRSEPRAQAVTNARGEATYTFVGSEVGRARISAEVTDGVRLRTLTNTVRFGRSVRAVLDGVGAGRSADRLTVDASRRAAGARVVLQRVAGGSTKRVAAGELDATGAVAFRVRDRNGRQRTRYVAVVRSTSTTVSVATDRVGLR
jgi:hypothetical protein